MNQQNSDLWFLRVNIARRQEDDHRRKMKLADSLMTTASIMDALVNRGAPFLEEIEDIVLACVELVGVHATNKLLAKRNVNAKLTIMEVAE